MGCGFWSCDQAISCGPRMSDGRTGPGWLFTSCAKVNGKVADRKTKVAKRLVSRFTTHLHKRSGQESIRNCRAIASHRFHSISTGPRRNSDENCAIAICPFLPFFLPFGRLIVHTRFPVTRLPEQRGSGNRIHGGTGDLGESREKWEHRGNFSLKNTRFTVWARYLRFTILQIYSTDAPIEQVPGSLGNRHLLPSQQRSSAYLRSTESRNTG